MADVENIEAGEKLLIAVHSFMYILKHKLEWE